MFGRRQLVMIFEWILGVSSAMVMLFLWSCGESEPPPGLLEIRAQTTESGDAVIIMWSYPQEWKPNYWLELYQDGVLIDAWQPGNAQQRGEYIVNRDLKRFDKHRFSITVKDPETGLTTPSYKELVVTYNEEIPIHIDEQRDGILITWERPPEITNSAAYEEIIYRSDGKRIHTTDGTGDNSYLDRDVIPGKRYIYFISCFDVTERNEYYENGLKVAYGSSDEVVYMLSTCSLFPVVDGGEWTWQNSNGAIISMKMTYSSNGRYLCVFDDWAQVQLDADSSHLFNYTIRTRPNSINFLRNILGLEYEDKDYEYILQGGTKASSSIFFFLFLHLSVNSSEFDKGGVVEQSKQVWEREGYVDPTWECLRGNVAGPLPVVFTPRAEISINAGEDVGLVLTPYDEFENAISVKYLYETYTIDTCESRKHSKNSIEYRVWFVKGIGIVKVEDSYGNTALLIDHNIE